jgi:transposase
MPYKPIVFAGREIVSALVLNTVGELDPRPAFLVLKPEQSLGAFGTPHFARMGVMTNNTAQSFIGIDVSKDKFDYFIRPSGDAGSLSYTPSDVAKFLARLSSLEVALVVMEATGGYEKQLAAQLSAAGLLVAIVNPRQIRDFAKSTGQLAKSDALDASITAHFAESIRPKVRPLPDADTQALQELVTRRDQLIQIRTAESNRLQLAAVPKVKKSIQRHLKALQQNIDDIEDDIDDTISNSPIWKEKDDLLQSTPSVGENTSHKLLAAIPELGRLNRAEVAALVGLAPYDDDSGKFRGVRHIRGGRAQARSALYMAAVSAIRCNPAIKKFYTRLRSKGKAFKVAITACMRKLLTILNYILKTKQPWRDDYAAGNS